MRIVRGKDYYDSALAYGRDESIIFVRNGECLSRKDERDRKLGIPVYTSIPSFRCNDHKGDVVSQREGIQIDRTTPVFRIYACTVLVAGKGYHGIRVKKSMGPNHVLSEENHVFWDLESFVRYLNKHDLYPVTDDAGYRHPSDTLENYFSQVRIDDQKVLNFMIDKRISILTVDDSERDDWMGKSKYIVIDGDNLKDFQFSKVMGAYTIMQELSMWVGGILPKEGPQIVYIEDDKVKLKKHAMDKWSFRKMGANSK